MGGAITQCHCRPPTGRALFTVEPWLYQSVILVPSVKYLLRLLPSAVSACIRLQSFLYPLLMMEYLVDFVLRLTVG